MKKLIFIVLVLILSGCSTNNEKEKAEIDLSKYEMKYNTDSSIIELEDGILFDFSSSKKKFNMFSHYLVKYQDGIATIVNNDDENGCNEDNLEKCTGSFIGGGFGYSFVFEDKLYYVNSQPIDINFRYSNYLSRCDLDGTNRENVLNLEFLKDMHDTDENISFNMHKGMFYITYKNMIRSYDLTSENLSEMDYEIDDRIQRIYFYDNYAYVITKEYNMDHLDTEDLFKIDLDTFVPELIYEDRHIYFVDETNILTTETNGDKVSVVLINHETKEQKVLFEEIIIQTESDDICSFISVAFKVFKDDSIYIITKHENTIDENYDLFDDNCVMTLINMYDKQGKSLNEYYFDGEISNIGVVDNQYYGIMDDKLYSLDLADETSALVEILGEYEK